jgi:hypothetical protein
MRLGKRKGSPPAKTNPKIPKSLASRIIFFQLSNEIDGADHFIWFCEGYLPR